MEAKCIGVTYIKGDKSYIQGLSGNQFGRKSRKGGKLIHNTGFGGGFEIEGAKLDLWLEIDGKERSYDLAYMAKDIMGWDRLNEKRSDFLDENLPDSFPINDGALDINAIEEWLKSLAKK
ncbi:hypothetical protein MKX70_20190 [Paenibacillus sp. FSL R7-0312]|uniref:hypothetical protein n=1 Tax=Paenibacillus sp. FSL R7-0312 TaxID=2921682 RepID=UPI0030F4C036